VTACWPTRGESKTNPRLRPDGETKPIYWVSGSIHSPETGSPEMLVELAYRLAVEESALIRNIRRNTIVMITPVSEVDGHDRQVDVYRYRKENPNNRLPTSSTGQLCRPRQ